MESKKLEDWPIKIIDGDRSSRYPKANEMVNEGVLFLSTPSIVDGAIDASVSNFVTHEKFASISKGRLEHSDIVMTTRGTIGKLAFFKSSRKYPTGLINAQMLILRPDPEVIRPKYLFYLMGSEKYQSQIKSFSSGSAQPQIPITDLKKTVLYFPKTETQDAVVELLDQYSNLIENNNRRIAILEDMAQSLYREWFVNFRYPNHQDNLDADGKPKLIDSPLGQIPEGWGVRKIKDLGIVITGKTPSTSKPEYYRNLDVPFLKTPDMHGAIFSVDVEDYLSDEGANSQRNKFIPANSVCVACIGAKAGVVTITSEKLQTNQQINSLILDDLRMREYFYLFAVSLHQKIHALGSSGATMTNVNKSKFEGIEVLIPPENLLESFHTVISPCFDSILNLQKRNKNLKKQRDMLLPKLISGQIGL